MPVHYGIVSKTMIRSVRPLGTKLSYIQYLIWALWVCLNVKPDWIYASDFFSCGPALIARFITGARILYHEHDSPSDDQKRNLFQSFLHRQRGRLAQSADLIVFPQAQRLAIFRKRLASERPALIVWNCPTRTEVSPPREPLNGPVTFYYHGSLNAARLPFTFLHAFSRLTGEPQFVLVGYETLGSKGYVAQFLELAQRLGVANRVTYAGAVGRKDALAAASRADVGLSFMPNESDDVNMAFMVGASNKVFDYMAVGQMVLVSDTPEWRNAFDVPGYGLACDPSDEESLFRSMQWCVSNPEQVRACGERGRQAIASTWNYETEFGPVLRVLEDETPSSSQ
jgi:glycosyltransferase involved in cell wall biosynthesis